MSKHIHDFKCPDCGLPCQLIDNGHGQRSSMRHAIPTCNTYDRTKKDGQKFLRARVHCAHGLGRDGDLVSPIDWDNDDDGDDDGPGVCEACGVPFVPGTHYLHVELMLDESQSEEETLTLCHAHTTAAEAIIHACEERRGEDEDDVIEDGYARVVLTRAADDFERSWVICGEHAQELFDLEAK